MQKDIISKKIITAITREIAHYILKINITDIQLVDKELLRIEHREADIVAICKINNKEQILHIEIQNNNDKTMPNRMLRYYTDIKQGTSATQHKPICDLYRQRKTKYIRQNN
ncbi:MAG: hypothetical protein DRQ51_07590 [Gammaproteobacteria bacterium]|nr:MAG: hypothetical protein DRQ51_07590 [Gammaproteobacteria bacterium]